MDSTERIEPTYRLLALCARAEGHPIFYERLTSQLQRFNAWDELPAQAELHGMAPLLRHHLRRANAAIPKETAQILDGLYARHRAANRVHAQTLLQVNALFAQAGIQMLLLKGLGLAYQCYPDPALRPVSDMDLLIRWQDSRPALDLLASANFRVDALPSAPKPVPAELTADSPLKAGLSTRVELHFHEDASREFDGLDAAPQSLTIEGQTIYVPDVLPTMRYLSRHLRRHLFAAAEDKPLQLKWIADLISLAEQHADKINWESLRRSDSVLLNQLETFYSLTPPLVKIKWISASNPPPNGINQYPCGWPQRTFAQRKQIGWLKFLRCTFSAPSEWWLRLYYGVGKRRASFYGAIVYPLQIAARIIFTFSKKRPEDL
ncbi:MAG: nucleotidyltransferase family protein [Anaerolineales bacterium]|nr:nucleotidyltransferase family protein [Anaerolineales bacterium]